MVGKGVIRGAELAGFRTVSLPCLPSLGGHLNIIHNILLKT